MKAYVFLLLAFFAILIAPCKSSPIDDSNVKCNNNCDLANFEQICGTDDAGHTRTFNNFCILKTENCLRNSNFQKTADGACP